MLAIFGWFPSFISSCQMVYAAKFALLSPKREEIQASRGMFKMTSMTIVQLIKSLTSHITMISNKLQQKSIMMVPPANILVKKRRKIPYLAISKLQMTNKMRMKVQMKRAVVNLDK